MQQSGDDEKTKKMLDLFRRVDADGSGMLSRIELRKLLMRLNPRFTEEEITEALKRIDVDGNGEIDAEEFLAWVYRMEPRNKPGLAKKRTSAMERALKDMISEDEAAERTTTMKITYAIICLYVGEIMLWDLRTGKLLRKMAQMSQKQYHQMLHSSDDEEVDLSKAPHLGRVLCITANFKARPALFLTGGDDHKLKLWTMNGYVLRTYTGSLSDVLCVAADWKNFRAVTGSLASAWKLWDLSKPKPVDSFQCEPVVGGRGVHCLAPCWEHDRLLVGAGKTLQVWDLTARTSFVGEDMKTPEPLMVLRGHNEDVTGLVADWEKKRAVTGSMDATVRSWDLEAGTQLQCFPDVTGSILCMSGDLESRTVAAAGDDCILRVWNMDSGECLQKLSGHDDGIMSVAYAPTQGFALTGARDGRFKVWDLKDGHCLRTVEVGDRFGGVWVTGIAAELL
eukprot:gnl/TRDRNA2_/TRDRNA2_91870_c0_seq1.p1 gnl/TRDRNA2_/TRDRNA2_91870_c0~~gnl/TRDRNA2_/TRDRNA2_91870_c0_seq1.p1  ORF type:complete len:464 (+),score=71.94 gnl/TRDRNA2_/TRDRNA2_91870_c0_seq1:41-1393(+)